jgi:hypothetical protein
MLKEEGKSVLGQSIYSVEFGNGPKRVLMWSQMHGNESTTTKAILDFLNFLVVNENDGFKNSTFEDCTIKIILVLNPDGLKAYSRENANKIDLNRDAKNLSQPESKLLRKVFEEFKPDYGFNLHDQRSIFSAGEQAKPATLSFLAPAYNNEKQINDNRKKAMQLIVGINNYLQTVLTNQIGRYSDVFNINCVGDYFQGKNCATLLFEAGHFPDDYQREETRKFVFMALFSSISQIIAGTYKNHDINDYENIPKNEKLFFDVLIRNANVNGALKDVGILYVEQIQDEKLTFNPKVEVIGDLSSSYGHQTIDAENAILQINNVKTIKKEIFIERISLNDEIFSINLTKS